MRSNWRVTKVEMMMKFGRLFGALRFTDAILELWLSDVIIVRDGLVMECTGSWTAGIVSRRGRAQNKPLDALLTVVAG